MKTFLLILFALCGSLLHAQSTCETAQPFCAGGVSGVFYPATTNAGAAQVGPYYGCLNTQPNPAWYFLQIANSGNLDILIQGQNLATPPGPGQDVDFICWGPFSSLANVCNSLTASYTVDCSYSSSFTETLNIPNGISGEFYMVLITNFANVNQNIIFNQFGGTGTTNCSLVNSNKIICYGSVLTLSATLQSGVTNASYALSPGNLVSQTPSFTVTPLVNTSYTLLSYGTNTNNVVLTQTSITNVTVNPVAVLSPTVVNTTCTSTLNSFNLGLHFNPTTANPAYVLNWNPAPNVVTTPTQVSGNGGINPGTYTATVVAAGGCSTNVVFTIDPLPASADFSFVPAGSLYSITCYQPTLNLSGSNANNSYTWATNNLAPVTATNVDIDASGIGSWTVNAINQLSGCTATRTLTIAQNTIAPTTVVTPTFQNITCSLSSITTVTVIASPSINVGHQIISPLGGTVAINSNTGTYPPTHDGIFTDCAINLVNGCKTCETFTVFSNQGYPTFNVVSPQNFTIGCNSKNFAIVNLVNGNTTNPASGPVTYTALAPGMTTVLPPGWNGTTNTFTTTVAGTWTFVIKDMNTSCETREPVSILSNSLGPVISSVTIPAQILTCIVPQVTLEALSLTPNVSYNWIYKNITGTQANLAGTSISVAANFSKPTNTLISNYTLAVTDNNNTCVSYSVIPMLQNTFPPKSLFTSPTKSISCNTMSITLSNSSSSGIPDGIGFPNTQPAIGYLWQGPSPQTPQDLSTTYIAQVPGNYTLTAKDLNNGCTAQYTSSIANDRVYPPVNSPEAPPPSILDCGASVATVTASVAGDQSAYSYTWAAPPAAVTGDPYSRVFKTPTVGVYKLVVLNTKNGCASSGQYTVENGKLNADFEADQISGYAPLTVNFRNNSRSTLDTSKISSIWSFGNGNTANTKYAGALPSTVYSLPGTYTVSLFVNKGSCIESTTKVITVDFPSQLTVPNIFTPNGDNINDVFYFKSVNLTYISITISDRWGHRVYELTTDKGNVLWDGKNQYGNDASDGVYFYTLKAIGKDGNEFAKKGTITLLR